MARNSIPGLKSTAQGAASSDRRAVPMLRQRFREGGAEEHQERPLELKPGGSAARSMLSRPRRHARHGELLAQLVATGQGDSCRRGPGSRVGHARARCAAKRRARRSAARVEYSAWRTSLPRREPTRRTLLRPSSRWGKGGQWTRRRRLRFRARSSGRGGRPRVARAAARASGAAGGAQRSARRGRRRSRPRVLLPPPRSRRPGRRRRPSEPASTSAGENGPRCGTRTKSTRDVAPGRDRTDSVDPSIDRRAGRPSTWSRSTSSSWIHSPA